MAYKLPQHSPQTSLSSVKWASQGSQLSDQARDRYLKAGRLRLLAEQHRRQAELLEAEAAAEEAQGDRLVELAVRRREQAQPPQGPTPPWVRGGGGGGGGAQPAQSAAPAPQAGPIPNANGAMKGHAPEIFDGQRKNAAKFIRELGLWKICKIRNEAMTNPFQRVALALSYMKGPKVDDWVLQQGGQLAIQVQ